MAFRRKHSRDRPRGWLNLFIRLGGWSAVVLSVLYLTLTLIGHLTDRAAARFEAEGVAALAEVTGRRIAITRDEDGDETRTYYLNLAYDTGQGRFEQEVSVGRADYERSVEGSLREIVYLPDTPQRIEANPGETGRISRVLVILAVCIGGGALALLWRYGQETNHALLARRDGVRLVARVTGTRRTNVKVNEKPQARLLWAEPDGRAGQSLMRDESALAVYRTGDPITVFRLGDESWWEGDVGPRRDAAGPGGGA